MRVKSRRKEKMNHLSIAVSILFILTPVIVAQPSNHSIVTSNLNDSKALATKNLKIDLIESDKSDDYKETMIDIFAESVENDERINLDECVNIVCIEHYLCVDDIVVTNGSDLIEWKTAMRSNPSESDDTLTICEDMEVPCCADQAMKILNNDNNENSDEVTKSSANDINPEDDSSETEPSQKCGYRYHSRKNHRKIVTKITADGEEAKPNEFPWMVGIFVRLSPEELSYLGGGSLIHTSVILTAAHLLDNIPPKSLVIRAGVQNILRSQPNHQHQERNVTRTIIHEKLYKRALINDIALLVTNKPFQLTDFVNTICLPPQNIHTHDSVVCTATGWGKNTLGKSGRYQTTLKKINLPVVERAKCQRKLRTTRLGPYYKLHRSFMCAGGNGRDTCKGDGGSPLVCRIRHEENRYYQVGIVAGGVGCSGRIPGMHVDVSRFTNWILQQLQVTNLNLDPENILNYELFE